MRRTICLVCVTVIVATLGSAVSGDVQINTYTLNSQFRPSVAMDSSGNSLVTWASENQDGSGYGVYGQRYDATGAVVGGEFKVNTYTTGEQTYPSVAMDSSGNSVVTWQSMAQDTSWLGIFGQRYGASGNTVGGEFQINSYTPEDQSYPSVAMDSSGRSLVTWMSYGQDGSGYGVYGQRYDTAGNTDGAEFNINTHTNDEQGNPSVAMNSTGKSVVTWQSYNQDGSGYGIYGQRYDAAGNTDGGEFKVNTHTASQQYYPSVAMDSFGNFLVTWSSDGQDGNSYGIFGQRYNADGSLNGSEFQINTHTSGQQVSSSVAMDSNGNSVVTWISFGQDGSSDGIFGQRYDATGAMVGDEFQINTYTSDAQAFPSIAMNANGNSIVTWQSYGQDGSGYGVYGNFDNLAPVPVPGAAVLGMIGIGMVGAYTRKRRQADVTEA